MTDNDNDAIDRLVGEVVTDDSAALMDDCTTAINVVLFNLPPILGTLVLRERLLAFGAGMGISPEELAAWLAA